MNAPIATPERDPATTAIAGKPALVLKSSEFRKGREAGWRDLETLVAQVERRGTGALSLEQLQRLPVLYRAALSSLSVSRTIALDRNVRVLKVVGFSERRGDASSARVLYEDLQQVPPIRSP